MATQKTDSRLNKDSCFKIFYEDAYKVTYADAEKEIIIMMKFKDVSTYEAYKKLAEEIYDRGSRRHIR